MFNSDIEKCVEFESTSFLAKKSLGGVASHFTMLALLLSYMAPKSLIDLPVALLVLMVAAVSLVRGFLCVRVQNFEVRRWHSYFAASLIGTGVAWCVLSIYILIHFSNDRDLALMLILMLGGMAAACTASLVPLKGLAVSFVAFVTVPPIVGMYASGNAAWVPISLSFIIYSALMITMIKTNTRDFWRIQSRDREFKAQAELLVLSEKQAREASQLKSEFLSTMSHEIRTPINAIIGLSELLLETQATPLQEKYHRTLRNSGESLLLVINDILDFSKIESGKLNLERIEFSLGKMVEHQLEIVAGSAAEKNLILGLHIDPDLPEKLLGDSARIGQVLLNLLSNAVKFTESGRVDVRVTGARLSDTRFEGLDTAMLGVKIEVIDTGIGLSKEAQTRLFNPFTQADNSTSRRFGGTGLGLSISFRLVEMMRGQIGVRSFEGLGSTFTVEIPLAIATERTLAERKDRGLAAKPHRIWVIESDRRARESCLLYLKTWGWTAEVIEAKDISSIPSGDERSLLMINKDQLSTSVERELVTIIEACKGSLKVLITGLQLGASAAIESKLQKVASSLTMPLRPSEFHDAVAMALFGDVKIATDVAMAAPAVDANSLPSSLRILVAEDNPTNQMLITALLKKMGCDPKIVANGSEALLALNDKNYDVILMDCQMPEMDGYQTTKAIREDEKSSGRHLPIIALTANAMKEDRQRCLDMGMDDYLAKPVRRNELCQALKKWSVHVA